MKIMSIIGTRPQYVKVAPLSKEIRKFHEEILVDTGQHYDKNMSSIFFEQLGISIPDYNLAVGSGNHGAQTAKMLSAIEELLLKHNPDGVVVLGDTNSTLAATLGAIKLNIPVFHIEAGLRSYNRNMPEEQNRIIVDHVSSLLFCPTASAIETLTGEGITEGVYYTGDLMYDAVLQMVEKNKENFTKADFIEGTKFLNKNKEFNEKDYYLATIHRAENTDNIDKLKTIIKSFSKLDKKVIFPVHPRTLKIIKENNINTDNIIIIEPVGYQSMMYLLSNSAMLVTDSGGMQKEAFFLGILCTTLRNETEWLETLVNDCNMICRIDESEILEKVQRKMNFDQSTFMPFGDGKSAAKIVSHINDFFENKNKVD